MVTRSSVTNLIKIALIAASGSFIGSFIDLPLTELFGAAILVVVLRKQFSVEVTIPSGILIFIQVILGISVGATMSMNELIRTIQPEVVSGLIVCLLLQTGCGYWWLHHREKWSPFESLLGAVPGAMAAILVISESQSRPSPKVVYSHSVRLILLIMLVGFISTTASPVSQAAVEMTWEHGVSIILVCIASVVAGKLCNKFGIPAPYMLSGLLVAAIYNGAVPLADITVPVSVVLMATGLLGVLIGARLANTTLKEALAYSRAGMIITCLGIMIAALCSAVASWVLGISWLVLLLSWLPGSVEAMTAVAILLGLEPAFVMVNHAIRLLILYVMPALLKNRLEQLKSLSE